MTYTVSSCRAAACQLALAAAGSVLLAGNAAAYELSGETYTGSIDTTLSYGVRSRVEDRDEDIVGRTNGGTAFSVNGDDGNLNFDEGIASNAAKITSELQLDFDGLGAFIRGTAFYDYEIIDEERERTPLGDEAEELVGRDAEILDAYVWKQFEVGENRRHGEVRVGNQVLSWGESTFIQNSINTINPVDVAALRVPGAELREALEPIPIVSASLEVSDNGSLQAFYQIAWKETVVDPSGTYFSTNDGVGPDGERFQLGFTAVGEGDFLSVSRGDDNEPEDEGQFGLAYRLYAPELNDTEFGFYYIKYHSRLPIISGRTGTAAGIAAAGQVYADAGVNAGDSATVDAFATDAYAQTAEYFIDYPEDIQLFGVSFNTLLGTSGVALQGEVSHRVDVPLQVDETELLFAALGPISPTLASNNQVANVSTPETVVDGFIQRDVTQLQVTATKVFSNLLGASQLAVVGEVGYTYVHDFPDTDELRLEVPGTYLSGNQDLADRHGPGAGLIEPASAFADRDSWGYRLLARLTYDNAIGSVNLTPHLAWAEDVNGNSPGPGGNFLEGRQALTLGLGADYLNQWTGDLSYTRYDGAGRYNLINDRDFIAFNVKYSF